MVAAPGQGSEHQNETIRLLVERASCRKFKDEKVPADVMHTILRAGIHAATGGNLQPYSIIKIEDEAVRKKLAELNLNQPCVEAAPVSLLFCIDWRRLERWANRENAPFSATSSFRHFWISFQDTVITAQNIVTAADALGLGSVYIGTVLECFRKIRDMFDLPRGVFPVVLLCLGYPEKRPEPRNKLPVEIVVHDGRYREIPDGELLAAFDAKYKGTTFDITDEKLEKIARACRTAGGATFEKKCVEGIRAEGRIKMAQRYFGTHYVADEMPEGNDEYLKIFEEFGFDWFNKFIPYDDRT
jgi:nitroreductase